MVDLLLLEGTYLNLHDRLGILGPHLEAFTEGGRVGPPGHSFSSRPSVDKGF